MTMKDAFGSLKAKAWLGFLAVLCSAGVAQAFQCQSFPNSIVHYSAEFGAWCSGVSTRPCTACSDDTGAQCATYSGECDPTPLNQNPNP